MSNFLRSAPGRLGLLTPFVLASLLAACTDGDSDGADDSSDADVGTEADTTAPDTGVDVSDLEVVERCVYPTATRVGYGEPIPDIAWSPAFRADGTTSTFDLYDFHCSPEFAAYETLVVVVTTVWCPNCPQTIDWVDKLSAQLEAEGALILFVEAQDAQGGEASSQLAQNHISRYATLGSGIRVGDANATPRNAIATSPLIRAFPSAFIVRKRDMRIITDSSRSNYLLPFVEIAMDPEADWSTPPPPEIVPVLPANCGETDEESSEPNNSVAQAVAISPGTFRGGVCTDAADFYRIDIAGDWNLTLDFDPDKADLDLFVWDEATNESLVVDGRPVGSYSADQTESFDYSGPVVVVVAGYQGATELYTLTLTER